MKKLTITIPVPTGLLRYWKWGLLALLALAVTLTWGYDTARRTQATTGDVQIRIWVADSKFQPDLKVANTCWRIYASDPSGTIQIFHDEVGDDGKACPDSVGKLGDVQPGPGWLTIIIPKAQLKEFGPYWHVVQSQTQWGYQFAPTKYVCDFSFLPFCEFLVKNVLSGGTMNVVVRDKTDGSLVGDPVQCVNVYIDPPFNMPPGTKYCDGDTNDKDPDLGEISVTRVGFGNLGVALQLSNTPPGRIFDENQGPAKQTCVMQNTPIEARKCTISFSYIAPPQININNYGQYLLPKSCFGVRDALQNPLFVVCDNDFQGAPENDPVCIPDGICNDEDSTKGLVRVSVAKGLDFSVVMTKVPYIHTMDPSKLPCSTVGGAKCEVTFSNAPQGQPWFPWDVAGSMGGPPDGQVDLFNDILGVIGHWMETKR